MLSKHATAESQPPAASGSGKWAGPYNATNTQASKTAATSSHPLVLLTWSLQTCCCKITSTSSARCVLFLLVTTMLESTLWLWPQACSRTPAALSHRFCTVIFYGTVHTSGLDLQHRPWAKACLLKVFHSHGVHLSNEKPQRQWDFRLHGSESCLPSALRTHSSAAASSPDCASRVATCDMLHPQRHSGLLQQHHQRPLRLQHLRQSKNSD